MRCKRSPYATLALRQGYEGRLFESVRPFPHWMAFGPIEFFVTFPNQSECIVVEPQEHVQSVLEYALTVVGVPPTRAFAAQPPAELVHADVVPWSDIRPTEAPR